MTKLGLARWYVDADTLGLAHVLIRARPDVTFAGDDGTRHTGAILAAGAQMFAITDPGQLRVWDLLEILMYRWRDMERLRERPGPYIFALSRTRMTEIDLM